MTLIVKIKETGIRRLLITCIAAVLLILLYCVIFRFSAQEGEESSSISMRISEKSVEIINSLSGSQWSDEKVAGLAESFERPVRKLAHFSEYACMGILVYVLWSQWMKRGRRLYLLTAVWVIISASFDEIHQLFVPGRYGRFLDVLVDTCGGVFGMLLCVLAAILYQRHSRRRQKKQGKNATSQCL